MAYQMLIYEEKKIRIIHVEVHMGSRAGGSGWAEPTPGQENNQADRAGPDLNRPAISLTQPGPISG